MPLGVHKMDSARRMPKFNVEDVLYIVQKVQADSVWYCTFS